MAPLNIHPDESATKKRKNNKALKIVLGIGALIAVPAIGSTLAAQITIGTGDIQFGQGVQQAVACDNQIVVTPLASFTNADGGGTFKLASIEVTGIAAGCNGKTFTLKVFNNTANSSPQPVASPSPSPGNATAGSIRVLFNLASPFSTLDGNSNLTITGTATSFKVVLATTLASSSVNKITVETN